MPEQNDQQFKEMVIILLGEISNSLHNISIETQKIRETNEK